MSDKGICYICKQPGLINRKKVFVRELRAYGPNEELICFDCCKNSSPEEKGRMQKIMNEQMLEQEEIAIIALMSQNDGGCGHLDCKECFPGKENLH